jgi:cellulose synthase/poly-beta-1,6-N-acetylglucosamine synthase-like glycosyltransferase
MILNYIVIAAYLGILGLLTVYCIHRYYILYTYFKYRQHPYVVAEQPARLPPVTVQLPLYNEMYVIRRLLRAAAGLRYPKELLEIQVLDDSTDETSSIALEHIRALREEGYDINYFHRAHRHGFKAGALQAGLERAKGDLIAIFDADFVPGEDFLLKTVPHFSDPKVGMVQTRWGHINRNYSLLTRLQAILLDAHFVLEHAARNRAGRFFNFNGTAGIWRKEAILCAGGWQHDTLTEDLDLSYRAQLKGWNFVFLPEVVTPAEIPVDMNSFKTQQHRWSKGSIETAKKLLCRILKSSQPLPVKVESFCHLTGNISYLLVLLLAVLAYPALATRITMGWRTLLLIDFIFLLGSTLPVGLYFIISQREVNERWTGKIFYLPLLMALGIGLCVNNGRAVIEALVGHETAFLRTPKFRIEKKSDSWKYKKYGVFARTGSIIIELALGCYFLCAIMLAIRVQVYTSLPFLLLFCGGFFYVAVLSLYQGMHFTGQSEAFTRRFINVGRSVGLYGHKPTHRLSSCDLIAGSTSYKKRDSAVEPQNDLL